MPLDVAIRGAGPVGLTLALLLRQAGCAVAVQGRRDGATGFRPIALSHASRLILERAGAWHELAPTPILSVHVSQQASFGRTLMHAAYADVPALGYVIDYGALQAGLARALERAGLRVDEAAQEAQLTVHAEGASEAQQSKDYGQVAIVASVATRPHAEGTAWERFTPEGPLALLPLEGRYCVVWGMSPQRAGILAGAPERDFLDALGAAFGRRAGEFIEVSHRSAVPLALRRRASSTGPRAAYVGNAAQTLHPVAGQGMNLGLRDAWDLAQALRGAADPGEAGPLQRYAAMRRMDAAATVRITDLLAAGLLGANPLARLARGIGLTALDICVPARRFFARRMIYGPSAMP
jgi:2-octaprenyl-6-methoxyphenol hydroxylase